MWKKIRSNPNPGDSIYSEIKKEFRPYFEKASAGLSYFLQKFPSLIFALMVLAIVLSIVLTFTVFRHSDLRKTTELKTAVGPLNQDFDKILRAGAQLKETIRLKKVVDSISTKKQLSATDSIALVQALDSLQNIHPSFK